MYYVYDIVHIILHPPIHILNTTYIFLHIHYYTYTAEILKIESYWRNSVLLINKYKKDGLERGLILRPSDELRLDLEDHMVRV